MIKDPSAECLKSLKSKVKKTINENDKNLDLEFNYWFTNLAGVMRLYMMKIYVYVMKYNNQQKQKIKTYFGNKTQKTLDRASYCMLKDIKVSCKVKQVGSLIALLPKNE